MLTFSWLGGHLTNRVRRVVKSMSPLKKKKKQSDDVGIKCIHTTMTSHRLLEMI